MSNYEVTIKVDIKKTENSTSDSINKNRDGSFRIVLPQESAQSIDLCEQALIEANYPALRDALSCHLSGISKEEAETSRGILKKTQRTIT
jgi:hypothetical protein